MACADSSRCYTAAPLGAVCLIDATAVTCAASVKFWESPLVKALVNQPVNCSLIVLCVYIWYVLRSRRWGWEEVGSSYKNVVYEGQVWRIVSSSFSHVDLLHLAMNMASLYQVGWLEEYYGSVLYLHLSLALVVLTMLANFIIYHVLIVYFRKVRLDAACASRCGVVPLLTGCCSVTACQERYIETIGVGYSCVLFALIVVATAKQTKYCPLPGLRKVCLPTWQVPLPFLDTTVPFSIAPFLLLVAMHYIVPKASFVGHLSGIVLGYPLVWGVLDWCSPELLARLCVVAVLLRARWFPDGNPRASAASGGVQGVHRLGGGAWAHASPGAAATPGSAASPAAPLSPSARPWSSKSRPLLAALVLFVVAAVMRWPAVSW